MQKICAVADVSVRSSSKMADQEARSLKNRQSHMEEVLRRRRRERKPGYGLRFLRYGSNRQPERDSQSISRFCK